jgi:hypothetical protein
VVVAGVSVPVVVGVVEVADLIASTGTAILLFGLTEINLLNNLFNSSLRPAFAICLDSAVVLLASN